MKEISLLFLSLYMLFVSFLLNAQSFELQEITQGSYQENTYNPLRLANIDNYYSATHLSKLNFLYSCSNKHLCNSHPFDVKKRASRSFNNIPINNIVLLGTLKETQRLKRWLHDIAVVPKGYRTLKRIEASGHRLTIKHSDSARLSSGRTIAPMTNNLINGTGADVTIIFDAKMSDRGTHRVFSSKSELIEFNAQQNLFHELAHAMHQMQGTWRYFDSERQAIEEENEFRIDLAEVNRVKANLRYFSRGVLISKVGSGGIGYRLSE